MIIYSVFGGTLAQNGTDDALFAPSRLVGVRGCDCALGVPQNLFTRGVGDHRPKYAHAM